MTERVKFDLAVFLESVGSERYTQDLLHHGVDTLDKLATLTQDKLTNWNFHSRGYILPAIRKAARLMKSSNSIAQEELLVRDSNFIVEKKACLRFVDYRFVDYFCTSITCSHPQTGVLGGRAPSFSI